MNRIVEQLKRDPCAGPMPGDEARHFVPFQHAAAVWGDPSPAVIERTRDAARRVLAWAAIDICKHCRNPLPAGHDDSHVCALCVPRSLP